MRRKLEADVTLSTGRTVTHRYLANNSQEATVVGGNEMTSSEWEEYCEVIKARAAAEGADFTGGKHGKFGIRWKKAPHA